MRKSSYAFVKDYCSYSWGGRFVLEGKSFSSYEKSMEPIKKHPFAGPLKKKGRFVNPHCTRLKRSLWAFILWQVGYYKDPSFRNLPPRDFSYPAKRPPFDATKPSFAWIGHNSFLIQAGINILTDPIFSDCCAPVSFLGPKRRGVLPLTIDELPRIDFVLLSHDHYDHLDEKSVRALHKRFPACQWVVPLGLKKWFTKRKIGHVVEFLWGDTFHFSEDVKITAVPAQHFSGRGLFDMNRTLWCGYVIEFLALGKKVYFVGDTGYNPIDFKAIGHIWQEFDLSLIPIGAYCPRAFMQPVHINPEEAVKIHEEVHSKLSVGMHWQTFRLADEPMHRPPYDLFMAMQERKLDCSTFLVVAPGERINF